MYSNQLKTFIIVADCGSFSKAAEQLYVTTASIMKQMNSLEERIDIKLLNRSKQGISLTPAGKSIYKDGKKIIEQCEAAVEKAKKLSIHGKHIIKVGTSILNPCKVLLDIWNKISDHHPEYTIQIIPFDDEHNNILSVIERLGTDFDFIVGVCDSSRWLKRANMLPLGTYNKCISMPAYHKLSSKKKLKLKDLYGETLMMVQPGDSPVNDFIRNDLMTNHPQINLKSTYSFYDINTFNDCEQTGNLLLNIECWKDVHPSLVTLPVEWDYEIPYGLLYSLNPSKEILSFIELIKERF